MKPNPQKKRPSLRLVTAKEFSDCIRAALRGLPADERLTVNRYIDKVSVTFGRNMGVVSVMKLLFQTDPEMSARLDVLDEAVVDHALLEVSRD